MVPVVLPPQHYKPVVVELLELELVLELHMQAVELDNQAVELDNQAVEVDNRAVERDNQQLEDDNVPEVVELDTQYYMLEVVLWVVEHMQDYRLVLWVES